MEQIEMLWEFQQADMAADALEHEIKKSPNRLALKKNREFLLEQQAAVKRMEEEIAEMLDRVDMIKDAISRQEEQLKNLQKKLADNPPENLEQAKALTDDARRLLSDITGYEQEMKRIQKDASDHDRAEKDIRVKFAKVKAAYDKQRVEYEAEYSEQMKALAEKKRIAEEKAKGIDGKLLDRYKVIKQHCVPPVAKLINDQCGGCFMGLPSVTLRNIKAGAKIIECESCGRMIIQL
ncbi:MAG: C4-type zinc ribbon domain-containing protein [Eubacteriales bacterium]|nr:C4-type zinc ribbon domain-containing protein [Eubacteriales bacterium]